MDYSKPGCFGNAITYSNRSVTCANCEHTEPCSLAALQRIEELKALVSVSSLVKMSHTASQKAQRVLPESAQLVVDTMTSRQRKTVGILMTLENPTPGVLVQTLVSRLKWEKDEAIQLAKETVGVLIKHDLAYTEGRRIIMRY